MNIDLRDSLLRFIVPPALFWSVLYYFSDRAPIANNNFYNVLIFVASGFVIGAIGAILTFILDYIFGPIWLDAKGELNYWKSLEKYGYAQNKIATK